MIMQTELMKTSKPEDAAQVALVGEGEGTDEEVLLPGHGPGLKRWHLLRSLR